MLLACAHDIWVEIPAKSEPCSLWLWLRQNDLDPSSEADLWLLLDSDEGSCIRLSMPRHALDLRFEVRQDITAAVRAHAPDLPAACPMQLEHFISGALFVWDYQTERHHPHHHTISSFQTALKDRDKQTDPSDLCSQFLNQLASNKPI